jgi:hypothetical protein
MSEPILNKILQKEAADWVISIQNNAKNTEQSTTGTKLNYRGIRIARWYTLKTIMDFCCKIRMARPN